ncbi:MAG: DUF1573 domain-containing protein [Pirellulales bacterium]
MCRAASTWSLFILAVLVPRCVCSEPWAPKMFETRDHDFGTVARGSDTVFKFPVKNIWKEEVHLASVRSSCGCTDPSIENPNLKSHETGYIVAKFNTRTFTGLHSATLTVIIDKPFPTQVQLRVHGNIRGDVVFQPGSVEFGKIDQGSENEKKVSVTYAGRADWKITDVVAPSDSSSQFEVELTETGRQAGRVAYDLLVRLKPTAPAGYLNEQLVIVTNDGNKLRIPLDVQGQIVPELAVSPENLVLGDVPTGQTVSKKLIVRGKKPFKITDINCADQQFTFTNDSTESKAMHIVEVVFVAKSEPSKLKLPIHISTDLGDSFAAVCTAYANVVPPKAEESAEPPKDENDAARVAEQTPNSSASASTPGEDLAQDR